MLSEVEKANLERLIDESIDDSVNKNEIRDVVNSLLDREEDRDELLSLYYNVLSQLVSSGCKIDVLDLDGNKASELDLEEKSEEQKLRIKEIIDGVKMMTDKIISPSRVIRPTPKAAESVAVGTETVGIRK